MIIDFIGPNASGKTTILNEDEIGVHIVRENKARGSLQVAREKFLKEWPTAEDNYERFFPRKRVSKPWVRRRDREGIDRELLLRGRSKNISCPSCGETVPRYWYPRRGILKIMTEICALSDLTIEEMQELLESWPFPDMIVFVSVPEQTGWERYKVRDLKHYARKTQKTMKQVEEDYRSGWRRYELLSPLVRTIARARGAAVKKFRT